MVIINFNKIVKFLEILLLNWIVYKKLKLIFIAYIIIFISSCKNLYHASDSICDDGLYEPVCGYNGATFPNSCYAENSGITIYTQGECE